MQTIAFNDLFGKQIDCSPLIFNGTGMSGRKDGGMWKTVFQDCF